MKNPDQLTWILILMTICHAITFYSLIDLKQQINQKPAPSRVEIISNGQYHSYPVDGRMVKIVKDEK
jgi:hypothetical protein